MQKIIRFYGPDDPYFELANFYPVEIKLDRVTWPTVEHYFQAQKTNLPDWKEKIRLSPTGLEAKKIGWEVPDYDDKSWLDQREAVMEKAVRAKFEQHENLKRLLTETGEALLIEESDEADEFWGMRNGSGKNKMGRLLMRLRDEFISI